MHAAYPWRDGNQFRVLIDGEAFFPAFLAAIVQARRYIFLEMYLVESGVMATRFIAALREAAARGVQVCLLFDAFGVRGLRDADRARLAARGIAISYYNPWNMRHWRRYLLRDHRKLLIVDGEIAYLGGAGITDDFWPGRKIPAWRDTMIEVRGACVADWVDVFQRTWRVWSRVELPTYIPASGFTSGVWGRVTCVGGGIGQEIKHSLLNRVRGAERRVWLATAYFVPPRRILRALKKAARSGVDVRLLLPGALTDHPAIRHAGRRYYQRLLRAHVRIFEYKPTFNHSKVALCDDWVSIGSSNIDRWNLRWNLEGNQEVTGANLVDEVVAMFAKDFSNAVEIEPAHWRSRPWWGRWRERFWGAVDLWLERLSTRWKARQRGDDR
ncbi:MAG: phospholipase D-like domain-containing protein [Pseudomonadota bacterium]